jgi:hypothetical protein
VKNTQYNINTLFKPVTKYVSFELLEPKEPFDDDDA